MRGTGVRLAPWLVPAFLWAWLFFHLHYEWSLNPQYNYGWAVPVLAGFMFYLRWQSRPPMAPSRAGGGLFGGQVVILALLLPVRVIEEANPDWRLLSWFFALAVVGYSLLSLARKSGAAWVRHFAFPVCFPLVAVPWLVQFENVVIQGMTRAVAFAAVEIAGWIGVGAYQIGNIIELHNGFVGVDEACSGVKTLQASIMVSLVLGEFLQLRAAKRVTLLVAGAAWVFVCNVLRATALVIIAAKQGTEALTRWHDGIGTAVLVVGMGGLMAIAWFLREDVAPAPRTADGSRTEPAPEREEGWAPAALALGWLITIFAATELWYRSHERELVSVPPWHARWPAEQPTFRDMPIADTTRAILRYDQASSGAWEDPRAIRWWSFFARWEPQRTALQLVRSHSPEICLPAVGRTFLQERPPFVVETDAAPLRFRVYEFEQGDRPLFVFVCIQEDKIASSSQVAAVTAEWSARGRLLAAWRGQRNLGQRLLEIAVIGFDDFFRAREAFAATVRQVVEKEAPTG